MANELSKHWFLGRGAPKYKRNQHLPGAPSPPQVPQARRKRDNGLRPCNCRRQTMCGWYLTSRTGHWSSPIPRIFKLICFQLAFKMRPLRNAGGKPSMGCVTLPFRPPSPSGCPSSAMMALTAPWIQTAQWSIQSGSKNYPFPEEFLRNIRSELGGNPNERPVPEQLFFLDFIYDFACQSRDLDAACPVTLKARVPLGVTDPPLMLPGVWPLKSELFGKG